jgi:tRNA(Ile)-lysidine synthase
MKAPFEQAIAAFSPALPMAVGFSGGADSTALLLACHQRWPGQVHALHVHHGLQAAADDFERQCREFCEHWQVPLVVRKIQARHAKGQSPEDAARRARYAVFDQVMAHEWAHVGLQTMALAQHADDQVETLLLALSRGAGLAGISAMPACWLRGDMQYVRPLLQVPGQALREWLSGQGVSWVDDPSNLDLHYTRNRIRHLVLPALSQAFGDYRQTFCRSAAHAAEGQDLLRELAEHDLVEVGTPPSIVKLRALRPPRQANVLRHWLLTQHDAIPSAAQLKELQSQLACCTTRGHQIRIKIGEGHLIREGDVLDWYN